MISSSYINGSIANIKAYDPFNIFESDVDIILDTVNTAYLEYKEAISEYNLQVEFFEASDDNKKDNVSEAKTNFVDKLGKAIIEVGKKAIAFINNIIAKIQESTFGNKTDMEKVATLCRKNPGLSEDINKAFKEGNLQVADLKNIKELEDAYAECLRLARNENVDPNTIRGKWLKAKQKFGNMSESDIIKGIAAIGTVVSVASTGVGIMVNISKLTAEAKSSASNATNMAMDALDESIKRDKAAAAAYNRSEARDRAATAELNRKEAEARAADRLADKAKDYIKTKNENKVKGIINAANINAAKSRASQAASDAENSKLKLAQTAAKFVNNAKNHNESAEFDFDENGYMTESAGDAVRGIINTMHADMMKVYTTIANFNFKTLTMAQSILRAAIKGYNKPLKGKDGEDKEKKDKDED